MEVYLKKDLFFINKDFIHTSYFILRVHTCVHLDNFWIINNNTILSIAPKSLNAKLRGAQYKTVDRSQGQ